MGITYTNVVFSLFYNGCLAKKLYEKQKLVPRVGYCSTFVDRKWELRHKRNLNCENRSRNKSYEYDDNIDTYIESEDEEFS